MTNTIPYEIHLTVQRHIPDLELTSPSYPIMRFKSIDLDVFSNICKLNDMKPIFIDYQISTEHTINDVMTSSKFYGTDESVKKHAYELKAVLEKHGYIVCRVKIETIPTHILAPRTPHDRFENPSQYFEAHIAVKTDISNSDNIQRLCTLYKAHKSRNPFKKHGDNTITQMCTIRSHDIWYTAFASLVYDFHFQLSIFGEVDKPEIEFALFDTNTDHDADWLQHKS